MVAGSTFATVPRQSDREIERVRTVARFLDGYGLDAILGLVLPGVGDIAGSMLGLYIVAIAVRRRIPAIVVARMLLNLGVDMLLGVVPLLGDLTDFVFRANQRNLALLETRAGRGKPRASDWMIVIAAGLGLVAAIALVCYAVAGALRWLF